MPEKCCRRKTDDEPQGEKRLRIVRRKINQWIADQYIHRPNPVNRHLSTRRPLLRPCYHLANILKILLNLMCIGHSKSLLVRVLYYLEYIGRNVKREMIF